MKRAVVKAFCRSVVREADVVASAAEVREADDAASACWDHPDCTVMEMRKRKTASSRGRCASLSLGWYGLTVYACGAFVLYSLCPNL